MSSRHVAFLSIVGASLTLWGCDHPPQKEALARKEDVAVSNTVLELQPTFRQSTNGAGASEFVQALQTAVAKISESVDMNRPFKLKAFKEEPDTWVFMFTFPPHGPGNDVMASVRSNVASVTFGF